jgi:hypothetical protein
MTDMGRAGPAPGPVALDPAYAPPEYGSTSLRGPARPRVARPTGPTGGETVFFVW